MDELKNDMNNCHSWVLPKGTVIQYYGIPYYLAEDTEVLGNTDPTKVVFVPPSDDDIRKFFDDVD